MAETKNRYQKALSVRVREEAEAEKKQEELRKKYGVGGDVSVAEKAPAAFVLWLLRFSGKVLTAVLTFVFILVLLDPEMRRLFLDMPLFDLIRGAG